MGTFSGLMSGIARYDMMRGVAMGSLGAAAATATKPKAKGKAKGGKKAKAEKKAKGPTLRHGRVSEFHTPFARSTKRPGVPDLGNRPDERKKNWACRWMKPFEQACEYIGPPKQGHKVGYIKRVCAGKMIDGECVGNDETLKYKRKYNKDYHAKHLKKRGKPVHASNKLIDDFSPTKPSTYPKKPKAPKKAKAPAKAKAKAPAKKAAAKKSGKKATAKA